MDWLLISSVLSPRLFPSPHKMPSVNLLKYPTVGIYKILTAAEGEELLLGS